VPIRRLPARAARGEPDRSAGTLPIRRGCVTAQSASWAAAGFASGSRTRERWGHERSCCGL